jgi:N-acetylglucosaminyl-diphospho-decaprenol L-rhamnosyltransferase
MPPVPEPALTVVVVTHNSAEFLDGWVRSWRAQAVAGAGWSNPPVIVADSGSTDDTAARVQALAPEARWLALENIGYGAAANRAIALAATPWVLLCNPDLIFPPPFLATLAQAATTPAEADGVPTDAGVVAPLLRDADGVMQPSVGLFPTLRSIMADQFRPRRWRKYRRPPSAGGRVDWATGACLLLRRAAFEGVGGFDAHFFLYVEELDFQCRLRRAGWCTWFCPAVQVVHLAPAAARPSSPQTRLWAARGLLRYFAKHGRTGQLTGYRALALLSGRLSAREALAPRQAILARATGPE